MKVTLLATLLTTAAPVSAGVPLCDGKAGCAVPRIDLRVQPAPATLRFQARVSQAKLADGRGLLRIVVVHLLDRGNDVCHETFENVLVEEGVLNLEIGAGQSCDLAEVIAQQAALSFKICFDEQGESCMSAVELPTVPFAAKANYSQAAEWASSAAFSGRAEYTLRYTADGDLQTPGSVGAGYFDMSTPVASSGLEWDDYAPSLDDGYIQWAPVRGYPGAELSLCGEDLGEILLHAQTVALLGHARVQGAMDVRGWAKVIGEASLTPTYPSTAMASTPLDPIYYTGPPPLAPVALDVLGESHVMGTLRIEQGLDVRDRVEAAAGAELTSASGLRGAVVGHGEVRLHAGKWVDAGKPDPGQWLRITEAEAQAHGTFHTVQGPGRAYGLAVVATSDLLGTTSVSGSALTVASPATFFDDVALSELDSDLGAGSKVSFHGRTTELVSATPIVATVTEAVITADAVMADLRTAQGVEIAALTVHGAAALGSVTHSSGSATFAGPVTFSGKTTFNQPFLLQIGSDEIPEGSITHAHLELTEASCRGGMFLGLAADGSASCADALDLSAAQPSLLLRNAGSTSTWTAIGSAGEIRVGAGKHVSLAGPTTTVDAAKSAIVIGKAAEPVDLAVWGDLVQSESKMDLTCDDVQSPSTLIGNGDGGDSDGAASVACAGDDILMSVQHRWFQVPSSTCTTTVSTLAEKVAYARCQYGEGQSATCNAVVRSTNIACLQVTAQCCRIQ
jgi:hypothetical protein